QLAAQPPLGPPPMPSSSQRRQTAGELAESIFGGISSIASCQTRGTRGGAKVSEFGVDSSVPPQHEDSKIHPMEKKKGLPNVHLGLHLANVADEYGGCR